MILSENSHDRLGFPAAAFPAPGVGERAVEFVGGHAEPKSGEPKAYNECEDERGGKPERPHHAASDDGGELGIARGTQRCREDEVDGLEGLHSDIAPEADFAEADDFGIVGIESDEVFAEEGDCDGKQESADDADGKRLADAAVCLVVIVCADEVGDENLVTAAEANAENDG